MDSEDVVLVANFSAGPLRYLLATKIVDRSKAVRPDPPKWVARPRRP